VKTLHMTIGTFPSTGHKLFLLLITSLFVVACDSGKYQLDNNSAQPMVATPAVKKTCLDNNPLRNAYFGDLHVHTGYSADGWKFGVRTSPQEAYQYAFGDEIMLYPNDETGLKGTRPVSIDRPLDFMAVTDHAEFYAEGRICTDPQYDGYDQAYCEDFRGAYGRDFVQALALIAPFTWRNSSVCGAEGEKCKSVASTVWQDTIQAAEHWNDSSENCERTTFVAYEYSSVRMGSNMHRNVIFRNTTVPPVPVSTIEAPRDWMLWEALDKDCLSSDTDCDVLAIPHNSNISNGQMFSVEYPEADSIEAERARAALRIKVEPLVEVIQHKGDSECRNELPGVIGAVDELCDFEQFEDFAYEQVQETFGGKSIEEIEDCDSYFGLALGPSCLSRLSYIRPTLVEGLKEEKRLGVNPYKFGLSSSTDTHNGLGGGVAEKTFPGHLGGSDDKLAARSQWSSEVAGNGSNNPGGLIGVWAAENSRNSLFEAMKNKEVFGTSGPRIKPRLFGGWQYDNSLCDDHNLLKKAYAQGVPMGGDLYGKDAPSHQGPSFLTTALADPGSPTQPGTPLQRIQIIKGWVDDKGISNEKVFEVAGKPNNGASVNLDTCETSGAGSPQLCSVWTDPEFDPSRRAVYYARAVENPSCRYTAWQCVGLEGENRPASCDDPRSRVAIQERALTSPIWYTPKEK